MSEVFRLWRRSLRTRVRLGSIRQSSADTLLCYLRNNIEPTLAGYRSDRLTAQIMTEWRDGLAKRVEAGRLSGQTFNNLHACAIGIFKWARAKPQSFMAHDPMIGQERLKLRKKEARFLEQQEIVSLLASAADDAEANAVVHIALFCGLRRSEVFGLQWSDVEINDEVGGRLRVERAISYGQVTDTKTVPVNADETVVTRN